MIKYCDIRSGDLFYWKLNDLWYGIWMVIWKTNDEAMYYHVYKDNQRNFRIEFVVLQQDMFMQLLTDSKDVLIGRI